MAENFSEHCHALWTPLFVLTKGVQGLVNWLLPSFTGVWTRLSFPLSETKNYYCLSDFVDQFGSLVSQLFKLSYTC